MKTKTIAKIQVILGIIFLLISIAGFISLGNIQKMKLEKMYNDFKVAKADMDGKNYSAESKLILGGVYANQYVNTESKYTNILISTLLASIILLAISLFFITQGIINLKEKKK